MLPLLKGGGRKMPIKYGYQKTPAPTIVGTYDTTLLYGISFYDGIRCDSRCDAERFKAMLDSNGYCTLVVERDGRYVVVVNDNYRDERTALQTMTQSARWRQGRRAAT